MAGPLHAAVRDIPLRELEPLKQEMKCKVCMMMFDEPSTLPCGHIFCKNCILQNLNSSPFCPLCRHKYTRRTLYPVLPLEGMIKRLEEVGTQLGISDIAATQMSQPMVIKPFVPPPRMRAALSQCLRDAKSQVPDFSDSESEDTVEPPSPRCPSGHTLKREDGLRGWQCKTHEFLKGECASNMKKPAKRRDAYVCEPCNYHLCLTCFNKFKRMKAEESSDEDEATSEVETQCVMCNMHGGGKAVEDCTKLVATLHDHAEEEDEILSDGTLGAMKGDVIAKELGALKGPFPVTWRVNGKKEDVKLSQTLRMQVWAHDLCLLWSPQTKVTVSGDISVRSVPAAARQARNSRCSACNEWGATLKCQHAFCRQTFHVPCGLFTSWIGRVDEEAFTVYCSEHASLKRKAS
eukprot:TRINITY_DN2291_c0_g2_i1.p1 TRINITY_DN2291_c0_g2~~TRINITY_DN2291_c0_g2_i1.p1  ORF type:complete len:425 (+),score=122.46 TRINITY_DN2291_c0_g2_i1:61-1275(+)